MTGQMSLAFEVEADQMLADAQEWRRNNRKAYAAIVAWAHEDAAKSHGRCSMQKYIEALRDPAYASALYVHRTDETYLFDHRLRSAVTRLILQEHPQLPFHIRKSRCDTDRGTEATPRARRRGDAVR